MKGRKRMWMLLVPVLVLAAIFMKEQIIRHGIADAVIRFHVLADSDREEDQKIKMEVKEQVTAYLSPLLCDAASVQESRQIIAAHMEGIIAEAQKALAREKCNKKVTARLIHTWFPEKSYGDCTFPPGVYEALQIRIGRAFGENWWCILYPGLCFQEALHGVVSEEGKQKLADILTDEEMDTILNGGKLKIGFRWFHRKKAGS